MSSTQLSYRENHSHLGVGTLGVLSDFRRLVDAVQRLVHVLDNLLQLQKDAGPALDRLAALELSRHQFEAAIEGKLLQADGKLKAASNAEQRERQLKRSYEKLIEERDLDGEQGPAEGSPVRDVDADASEAERVSALRLDVAPDHKAIALRAKWSA